MRAVQPPSLLFLLAVALVGLSACGLTGNHYARIERALQAGRPVDGLEILERHQAAYGARSAVLYLMETGMLQHLAGRYAESNQSLAQAEELSETLYTRRIRAEAEAFLTTDNALPYEGEDFEKVLLNVFMALNYAQLGQWDEAVVEARKVDHKLNVLSDRHQGAKSYRRDPLARYLSGILYEATGDPANAYVAYQLAHEAFQQGRPLYGLETPDLLRRDLLRLSRALGLEDEHQGYRRAFADVAWPSPADMRGTGELIVVTYLGRAPLKQDVFVDVPFSLQALNLVLAMKVMHPSSAREQRIAESLLYGLTGQVMRLAVPTFLPQRSGVAATEAVIATEDARHATQLAVVADITATAVKDLEERIGRTTVKAAARAAWKYALAYGTQVGVRNLVGQEGGVIAGALVGAIARTIALASEEADKRSWMTLPDRIQIGRVSLPPGTYEVEIRFAGPSGQLLSRQSFPGVTVNAGQKRFVIVREVQ